MSHIDRIVAINITRNTRGISSANFDTVLFLTEGALRRVATFTSPDELLDAGYTSDSAEYLGAQANFSQEVSPRYFKVGGLDPVSALMTVTGEMASGDVTANVYIDGVVTKVTETFDTDFDTTMGNLATAVAALTDVATCVWTSVSQELAFTPTGTKFVTARLDFDAAVSSDPVGAPLEVHTLQSSTESHVDALSAITDIDNDWYGLTTEMNNDHAEQVLIASWCKTNTKFYFGNSEEVGVFDIDVATDTVTLPYFLNQAKANKACAFCNTYSRDILNPTTAFPDVALAANTLARIVGTYTMDLKKLGLAKEDVLTGSQYLNAANKNAVVFHEIYGAGYVENPRVCDGNGAQNGEWIDVEIGLDVYENLLQEQVFLTLAGSEKIPYTDEGIGVLETAVAAVLQNGVDAGFFAEYEVNVEKALDQSQNDRANRIYNGLSFTARLAGAIHSVTIKGYVTV